MNRSLIASANQRRARVIAKQKRRRIGVLTALVAPALLFLIAMPWQQTWAGGLGLTGRLGSIHNKNSMPKYRQPDSISCGPTCVSMVLKYHGRSAGIGPLKTACGTRMYSGPNLTGRKIQVGLTLPAGIERGLERYGVSATVHRGASLRTVMSLIDQNRPPIMLVRSGRQTWHYIVAVAYYHNGSQFEIHDPGSGQRSTVSGRNLQMGWDYSGDYYGNALANPRCDTCAGSGKIRVPNPNLQCPLCSGSGTIKIVVTNPITGKDRVVGSRRCSSCGGSGRLRGNIPTNNCVVCGGRGHLPDPYRSVVGKFAPRNSLIAPNQGPRVASNGGGNSGNSGNSNGNSGGSGSGGAIVRLPIGRTYSGSLSRADQRYSSGKYYDRYSVYLNAGRNYVFDLHSSGFDGFLRLVSGNSSLAHNDDFNGSRQHSRISYRPSRSGTYYLVVTSYGAGETGSYRVSAGTASNGNSSSNNSSNNTNGPPSGFSKNGVLSNSDRRSNGKYYDTFSVPLQAGRTYTISLQSNQFDTMLILENSSGSFVARNDDISGANRNSRLTYRPNRSGMYRIRVTSFASGKTGRYVLQLR